MGELVSAVSVRTGTMTPEQVWTFERLLRQELPRATVHVCSGREVSAPYAAVISCPPFVHGHVTEHVAFLARMAEGAHPVTGSSDDAVILAIMADPFGWTEANTDPW
jgi:hypothetical protein